MSPSKESNRVWKVQKLNFLSSKLLAGACTNWELFFKTEALCNCECKRRKNKSESKEWSKNDKRHFIGSQEKVYKIALGRFIKDVQQYISSADSSWMKL